MSRPLLSHSEYVALIGPALKLLRERLNLRQNAVAELASITKGMYSAYETGRQSPSLGTLFKLLAALQADLSALDEAIFLVKGLLRPERVPIVLPEESAILVRTSGDGSGEIDIRVGGVIRLRLTPDPKPGT